jgi:hypothetical protein
LSAKLYAAHSMIVSSTSIKNGDIEQNPTSGRDANNKARMVKSHWGAALRKVTDLEFKPARTLKRRSFHRTFRRPFWA